MSGPRNTLMDLNNLLFEQMERLNDADVDELPSEIERSKAASTVAKTIIDNGKLALDAEKFKHDDRMDSKRKVPRMLASGAE